MDHFEETVPISTYLVAFLVSEFEYSEASRRDSNVTFRIWARKEALDQVDLAKECGPKVLSYFEKYFDMKYPLPKQDMVALPDFNAGAMENWGLITYRYLRLNSIEFLTTASATTIFYLHFAEKRLYYSIRNRRRCTTNTASLASYRTNSPTSGSAIW